MPACVKIKPLPKDVRPDNIYGLHILLPPKHDKTVEFTWLNSNGGHDYWVDMLRWQVANIKGSEVVMKYLDIMRHKLPRLPLSGALPEELISDEEAEKRSVELMTAIVVGAYTATQ